MGLNVLEGWKLNRDETFTDNYSSVYLYLSNFMLTFSQRWVVEKIKLTFFFRFNFKFNELPDLFVNYINLPI